MKIAILSNINIDLLKEYLKEYLSNHGISSEYYLGGFNQVFQELITPRSPSKEFSPNFLVVFIDWEELIWNCIFEEKECSEPREIIEALHNSADEYRNILINDVFIRDIFGNFTEDFNFKITETINKDLSKLSDEKQNVYVVKYRSVIEEHGWKNLFSSKMMYLGSMRFTKKGFKELAKLYGRYMRAITGKIKKVLVLDADGVLWGGVLGEDGLSGIKLDPQKEGRAYYDFQRAVKKLKNRGIVLALNSKNNEEDVKEALQKHSNMVLKEEDFAAFKVNWNDKVSNLREMAQELNLGLDSFVFIDDSKFEREYVKANLPEVVVPDFPDDTSQLLEFIFEIEREYFPKIHVTEEDRKRSEMYRQQALREKFKKSAKNLEDFLKGLEMKMIIGEIDDMRLKRVAQLTQRTNQFNMTTRRYTEQDIKDMSKNGYKIYWMRLSDRFGDNGVVGVIIVKLEDKKAYIDTFLMSCRVIGRGAERAFMWFVEDKLRDMGIEKIFSEYIPTKKNALVKDKYEELGYRLIEEKSDGSKYYEKDLPDEIIQKPEWIEVMENE